MTRSSDGQRMHFGVAEWLAFIALLFTAGGGWLDMNAEIRVLNTKVSAMQEQNASLLLDHEARIRVLERAAAFRSEE